MSMDLDSLKERFYEMVEPAIPNEWDVEESLEPLVAFESEAVEDVFSQIPSIWPVSHSLCFAYLHAAGPALSCLAPDELSLWVHTLLDRYETGGLHAAQLFMENVEQQFACYRRGQGGLRLTDIRGRLQPYVNGLAGHELPLITADMPATDGESLFLPGEISTFTEQSDNFQLYKLMASFQWACLHAGTFEGPSYIKQGKKSAHPLDRFFSEFDDPANARALYHFFETSRILHYLREELPGLMRQTKPLMEQMTRAQAEKEGDSLLVRLQQGLILDTWSSPGEHASDDTARRLLTEIAGAAENNHASLEAVREMMLLLGPEDRLEKIEPLAFQGKLLLQEMRNAGLSKVMDKEMRMMQSMHLPPVVNKKQMEQQEQNSGQNQGQDMVAFVDPETALEQLPPFMHSQMNLESALPPDSVPETKDPGSSATSPGAVSATEGMGGQVMNQAALGSKGKHTQNSEPTVYDEWDYRRRGFRKKWCVVTENELSPVRNTFMEDTLKQYRGQIRRLRHQFERLQTSERFIRRQREGSDIDVDAVMESITDARAGLPSSDRLFIRLARQERDIAVCFLVDMSNSTAGWVGQSIKEALVLICEALEVLNDRYAIYGFSGMRRLRCEVFPVKEMQERYSTTVRQRISAIGPREYTRMAPAIRHMTAKFAKVEAKVRLLIVLSDGKPEDYDDYKGDYAIEDTRHALFEAKAHGIHPFCITIDRKAHEYMAHMYGEVNYIFIDKVQQLPARMSEIYRTLTS